MQQLIYKDGFINFAENTDDSHGYLFMASYYCLESWSDEMTNVTGWDVFYCNFEGRGSVNLCCKLLKSLIRNLIKFCSLAVAIANVLIMLATLVVYALSKSYHTMRDKCEIILLFNIFLCYVSLSTLGWSYVTTRWIMVLAFFGSFIHMVFDFVV